MTTPDPMPQLIAFIQNELIGTSTQPVSADEDLLGGGRIDSMGIMRLVAFLESEFQVSAPPEDVTIENFETPRTIARYVQSSRVSGE